MGEESRRPTKGSIDSAGYDLYSAEETEILPWKRKVVSIQIAIKVPRGTYGRIASRSGLAAKHGIDVGAGVIDADYRGEVKILLMNHSDVRFEIKKGDRIAQLVLEKIDLAELNEVSELDETQRGKKGFGSTGMSERKEKEKQKEVRFDESEPEQKGVQGKILSERVDTRTRRSRDWSNTIDPWTCQWIKRVVDQKDEKHAIKHIRSFVHESRVEQVNSQLVQQLKNLTDDEAQFTLRELQEKPRFVQRKRSKNSFEIEGTVVKTNGEKFTVTALLDSGCTGTVIDKKFAKEKDLLIHKLPIPIPVYNADGTFNDGGSISEFALLELQIGEHKEQIAMALSNLSTHDIFLGHDWLKKHNPKIDWQTQEVKFTCKGDHAQNMDEEHERLFYMESEYLRNLSTDIAIATGEQKRAKTFEETVPSEYHEDRKAHV